MRARRRENANTVFFAGTVQEEVSTRGAMRAAEVIKPDIGFAIEVGIDMDTPGTIINQVVQKLRAGPGILIGAISTALCGCRPPRSRDLMRQR
ncbi:MAG: hypothetical protein ACREIC_16175 [Limisphaerales bacterium]